ncbi:MAG: hypothetical protein LBT79_03590 [Elusimicrobiota bacterium]|jgi:hypothetical protein|nr:hypothetical protein [Elusimicrobiota bacterium]
MEDIALAKPTIRGTSDTVVNFQFQGTAEQAKAAVGKAVKLIADNVVALYDGEGTPYGVAGYVEGGKNSTTIAVIRKAERTGVLIVVGLSAIVPGSQVFAMNDGAFSNSSDGNVGINAIFRSEAGNAINLKTGASLEGQGAYIDFIGGF